MKHLDRKYFRYRSALVARWQVQYPQRARVLAWSERLRLGFLLLSSALVATLCGVLAMTAIGRVGLGDWRPATFGAVALFSIWIVLRVFWSLCVEVSGYEDPSSDHS